MEKEKEKYIKEADEFLKNNKNFPSQISSPVMAAFAQAIVENKIHVPKHELKMLVKDFLVNERLEEFNFCFEEFTEVTSTFAFSFIKEEKLESSVIHF